jgi:hypothetical protein
MLTLNTIHGSLQVGGSTWTLNAEGYALVDGEYALYWQGTRLCEHDRALYLFGTNGQWYRWQPGAWVYVGVLPPEQVVTSAPNILAWNNGWWALGDNGEVLRHGQHIESAYGVEIHADDSGLYVRDASGTWVQWTAVWEASPGPSGPTTPSATPARSSADFIDSIGVTTHLNYLDTAYYARWPQVRDLLIQSGIRHVREGIPRMDPWYYDRIKEWHNAGVQFLAMMGKGTSPELDKLVADMPNIFAIEGLNEWDLSGDPDWANYCREYQHKFYKEAKKHNLTVLGPSLTSQAAYEAVGPIGESMDFAQLHNYYGTRNPETPGWGDDGYGSLDWHKRQSTKIAAGVLIWTVETGYPTDPGYAPRMPEQDMPEAACVRYITRLLCEQFAQNIKRTYIYQFVEDFTRGGPIDGFATHGLVRSDGTAKATYHAVKNLIGTLKTAGSSEGSLAYGINDPAVRHLLLGTSDGFALLLWLPVESMDPNTRELINHTSRGVTLSLPDNYQVSSINRMNDAGQWAPSELDVNDQLTLIHITGN